MMAIYYECHLTVAPVFGERLATLEQLAESHSFMLANGFSLWRRKIEAVVLDERFPRTPLESRP